MEQAPKKPLVSIIMNCYNSERFLKEAIDSVYAQTYSNWEIIFWDNASTDDSATIANSYDERLKYYFASNSGQRPSYNNTLMKYNLNSFRLVYEAERIIIINQNFDNKEDNKMELNKIEKDQIIYLIKISDYIKGINDFIQSGKINDLGDTSTLADPGVVDSLVEERI